MKPALCFLLSIVALFARAEDPWTAVGHGSNYIEATRRPADSLDASARGVIERLAKSAVPTAKDAESLALKAAGVLDARESWGVTGLYHLAAISYPKAESHPVALVWEVQIWRQNEGLTGVLWVDCDTRKVRVLYR